MSVSRLTHITQIGVEQMGALADSLEDPEVLRLENLDTDLRPPASALAFTKRAVDDDAANSYLPFSGSTASARRLHVWSRDSRARRMTGRPNA
jgi:hypothetical protein